MLTDLDETKQTTTSGTTTKNPGRPHLLRLRQLDPHTVPEEGATHVSTDLRALDLQSPIA